MKRPRQRARAAEPAAKILGATPPMSARCVTDVPRDLSPLRAVAVGATLRSCQLFSGLPAGDVEAIAGFAVLRSVPKDGYLFREGDPSEGFYVVQQGALNVHRVSAAGKEQVIYVFRAGESLAEPSPCESQARALASSCRKPRLECRVRLPDFAHTVRSDVPG